MDKLTSMGSMTCEQGRMHLVALGNQDSQPVSLVHTQVELDGNRVFITRVETGLENDIGEPDAMIGLVVSPVY